MGAFEVLLGGLDRRGNCPRIGHQPTSRQQSETEGSPKTEGTAERAIVRALSRDAARRAKEGEGLRGYKKGGLVHIIKWERKEGVVGRMGATCQRGRYRHCESVTKLEVTT